jgi:flagellar M-ring protein FliF
MPSNRSNFVNQLFEMWSRLLWPQRLTIIFFAILGLGLIGSIVYFMNHVGYEVLYRDLSPEDAAAIAAKLTEDKIDYEMEGTSIIKVAAPKKERDKLLLKYYGSSPFRSGNLGYVYYSGNQLGVTELQEKVNLQRALEGELARAISSLTEISQARVHLILRKDSPFEKNKENAKASVLVKLKNGAELSKSSIAEIKGLVAGAVEGLRANNVSIIENAGLQ